MYMLDTNTVSYLIHKRSPSVQEQLDALPAEDRICISVITEAELLYGVALKKGAFRLAEAVDRILSNLDIRPWTSGAAKSYAEFRAVNRSAGLAAGDLDLLISAHAIAEKAILVTGDAAIGKLAGGLVTVNWANDLQAN